MTIEQIRAAIAVASQVRSPRLRLAHAGSARLMINGLRKALETADRDLTSIEQELERLSVAELTGEAIP